MSAGVVRKDAFRSSNVVILRREIYRDADKAKLRLIFPHLRRALTIARLLDDKTVERDRFQEIVDGLSTAVLLIDATGIIRHANATGERMLADGVVLLSRNGRIATHVQAEQSALIAAIAAGDRSPISVPLTSRDGSRHFATILPLDNGYRREASAGTFAAAAVFVHDPATQVNMPGETLGKLFALTGAELRLLLALMQGGTLQEAADHFGVAITTVKTHLQRIFEKTGVSRQTDLIRKVMQLMPVAGWQPPQRPN